MTSFGGPVSNLGYLANNREGFSINTEFEASDFTISGGFGFYSELKRINSILSYNHISTGLILSRISYFSTGYGPYSPPQLILSRGVRKCSCYRQFTC